MALPLSWRAFKFLDHYISPSLNYFNGTIYAGL
jgi:hypothetical protein